MYVLHPVVAVLQKKSSACGIDPSIGFRSIHPVDVAPSRVLSPELPILVQPTCFCTVASNRLRVVNRPIRPDPECLSGATHTIITCPTGTTNRRGRNPAQ